jgi:ATP phosphoribosyltransferase regulatory subunit HisZ
MDELKYGLLADIQGRWQAELLKSFLQAENVAVELFQESLGQSIYPSTLDILGNVQVYVPKAQLSKARKLLKEFYHPPKPEKPKSPLKISQTTIRKPSKSKTGKNK